VFRESLVLTHHKGRRVTRHRRVVTAHGSVKCNNYIVVILTSGKLAAASRYSQQAKKKRLPSSVANSSLADAM